MTSRLAKVLERGIDHWALRLEMRVRAGGPGSFPNPLTLHPPLPPVAVRTPLAPVPALRSLLRGGSRTNARKVFR